MRCLKSNMIFSFYFVHYTCSQFDLEIIDEDMWHRQQHTGFERDLYNIIFRIVHLVKSQFSGKATHNLWNENLLFLVFYKIWKKIGCLKLTSHNMVYCIIYYISHSLCEKCSIIILRTKYIHCVDCLQKIFD